MKKMMFVVSLMAWSSVQAETLWTYGIDGNSAKGKENANEFQSSSGTTGSVNFSGSYTGSAIRMDSPGTGIGYLNDDFSFLQVCTNMGYGCASHPRDYYAASDLTFSFSNNSTKSCTGIALSYHRHGSEEDLITYTYQGSQMSHFMGGSSMESNQLVFNQNLPGEIASGDTVELTIDYNGMAAGNGHFIDYIEMTGNCTAACDITIDTDSDRLPDCYETNTSMYVSATDTGTDPNNDDTDGDSIKDGDEVLGTVAGLDLPAMGLNPLKKNILLEYDWFDDDNDCAAHSHRPTPAQIAMFAASFANSSEANPDGSTGIHVINDYGQGGAFSGGNLIADADGVIVSGVDGAEYAAHKASNFDNNRNGYFHYVLMPHRYNTTSGSSGQAEIQGDDLIVSLQCYLSTSNVANTIAHELGHNLNLLHGGDSNCNYKPNYNSVMNYRHQFPGVDTSCDASGDGLLDYSNGSNIDLNEFSLNENNGVCGAGTTAIDWNNDGTLEAMTSVDINPGNGANCGGDFTVLTDWNDWANIVYLGIMDGDGISFSPPLLSDCMDTPTN